MTKNQRALIHIAADLRLALSREAADVIAIGDLLLEAQEAVDYGDWLPWLKANFGSSGSTADNYMNAARFAARFPTVGNLKLRPKTLYLLGGKLDDPLFSPEAIEAILKVAEQEWVNDKRAVAIAKSILHPPETKGDEEERGYTDQEIDDIIDGPPQEVPQAPEPIAPNVVLPQFDKAMEILAQVHTKPMTSFAGTAYSPEQIYAFIAFLQAVVDAMTERKAA